MPERPKGPVRLGDWEIGVDPCHFCDEKAVTAWVNQEAEEGPRLVPVCEECAEKMKVRVIDRMRGACDHRAEESSPPCGRAVTHMVLEGFYVEGDPRIGLFASCPRHAELPDWLRP
jgi:hypothetical protein